MLKVVYHNIKNILVVLNQMVQQEKKVIYHQVSLINHQLLMDNKVIVMGGKQLKEKLEDTMHILVLLVIQWEHMQLQN